MNGKPDALTWAAFAATVIIGGSNFIGVSVSNMELPPLFGATLRFALAAMLFLVIATVRRTPLPHGRAAAGALVYGLLAFGVTYSLLYYALVQLPAGMVAVIVAAAPLFTLVLAVLLGMERPSLRGVTGSALAIGGIAVLSRGALGGQLSRMHLAAAILGTVAMAASGIIAKRLPTVRPVHMNAIGMWAGTALLAVGSLLFREPWTLPREPGTWLAVGWLVVMGSVGLFQLFLHVIRRWTASATLYAMAAMPVVAAALGTVLLDQPITIDVVAGAALVMTAVYIGAVPGARTTSNAQPADSAKAMAERPAME